MKNNKITNFKRSKRINGKVYYNYNAKRFNRIGTNKETGEFLNERNNGINLKLSLRYDLLKEIGLYKKMGNDFIEIRKNEIYLRGSHERHVKSVMTDLQFNYENVDNKLTYKNDKVYEDGIKELDEFCKKEFFEFYEFDIIEDNLENNNEVCVKCIFKSDVNKEDKLLIQVIKSFKTTVNKRLYLHKVDKVQLARFKGLIS